MPLYEYKCLECGTAQVFLEKVSAEMERKCTRCGGRAKRQISAPALQFKGSGWYVTDYGRGSGRNDTSTAKEADAKAEKAEKTEKAAEKSGTAGPSATDSASSKPSGEGNTSKGGS